MRRSRPRLPGFSLSSCPCRCCCSRWSAPAPPLLQRRGLGYGPRGGRGAADFDPFEASRRDWPLLQEFLRRWETARFLDGLLPARQEGAKRLLESSARPGRDPTRLVREWNRAFGAGVAVPDLGRLELLHPSKVVQFGISTASAPSSWDRRFQLDPPQLQYSCRFGRRFGAFRILRVRGRRHRPAGHASKVSSGHIRWFNEFRMLELCGLRFEFLFAKDDDDGVYFATSGAGPSPLPIPPVSIAEALEWVVPPAHNISLGIGKYSARIGMSFSRTRPVVINPRNVSAVEDVHGHDSYNNRTCMTDGCAPISRQILERVQTSLRLDQLPCAVQARLGPSKGVWYLASNEEEEEMATIGGSRAEDGWIKFTPSQKKFCLPDAEPHQSSVLDIVNVACNPKPSALNGGTIRVLESGGIPVSVFLQLQEEQVFRLERRLFSPDVNLVLRELHRYMRMLCNPGDAVTPSNLREAQLVDRCIALICAGATDTDPNVAVSKKIFACNYTRAMLQGMSSADPKLDVARSRYVMMVAPHRFNPLKARQVYCCLTSIDEETGREIGVLKGPLLLARNPCLLPTDVMLVEAVDASELSHLKDVLVMPVQGDRPLASDLAGGDYDGDLAFVTWDRRLTENFKVSTADYARLARTVNLFFVPRRETVGEAVNGGISGLSDRLFRRFGLFNSVRSPRTDDCQRRGGADGRRFLPTEANKIGVYYNWYSRLVEQRGLSDPEAITLALMCAKLIDAPKQDLQLDLDVFRRHWLKNEVAEPPAAGPTNERDRRTSQRQGLTPVLAPIFPNADGVVSAPASDRASALAELEKNLARMCAQTRTLSGGATTTSNA